MKMVFDVGITINVQEKEEVKELNAIINKIGENRTVKEAEDFMKEEILKAIGSKGTSVSVKCTIDKETKERE
jgi:hypothetical protein